MNKAWLLSITLILVASISVPVIAGRRRATESKKADKDVPAFWSLEDNCINNCVDCCNYLLCCPTVLSNSATFASDAVRETRKSICEQKSCPLKVKACVEGTAMGCIVFFCHHFWKATQERREQGLSAILGEDYDSNDKRSSRAIKKHNMNLRSSTTLVTRSVPEEPITMD